MRNRIATLLFNQVGVLLSLILVAFVAYVIVGKPAWAIDPLRGAASDVLGGMGVGLVLFLAWAGWFGWLLSRGFKRAIRQWRYVFGLAFLVAGAFSTLSYFHYAFPLIGDSPLGGEFGGQLRGSYGALGILRTIVLIVLGGWLVAPVLFNHAAVWTGRGALAASRGIGSGMSRIRHRDRGSVVQEVDDYLASNAAASRAAQISALRAADEYGRQQAVDDYRRQRLADDYRRRTAHHGQQAEAPRGLAYLEPTSPPPLAPRAATAGLQNRPERQEANHWPGLTYTGSAAPEPQSSAAATAMAAPPVPDVETGSNSLHAEPLYATEEPCPAEETPTADAPYVNGALHEDVEETLALAIPIETPWGEITVAAEPSAPEPEISQAIPALTPSLLPPLELLAAPVAAGSITEEHLVTAALIEETLAQHGVEVSVSEIRPGPSVTMFGIVPGWNRKAMSARARALAAQEDNQVQTEVRNRVKVDSILAREKDLALALAAPTLRIQAPVPGESLVGVEMPNKSSSMVTIRTVMESPEYERMLTGGGLPVALGLASAGEPVALDLLKMPHLLIAGATGSGKSVCINTIISSIICHQDPAKVRMLLVDPKRVELTPYNGIPHLVTPVVVDPDKVVRLLKGAIQEMMRRYKLLEEAGARNIASYNRNPRATEEMPYFVICIDELADLMMTASFDVEQSLCRLAQLGRATGIHLIVATQRPSVDVLTGLIKANFPSRIAFAVASQVDSRTILDSAGAERLLGRGDMLFISSDSPKPKRVQGVFISEDESAALSEHWRQLPLNANLPEIPLENMAREAETAAAESAGDGGDFDEGDSLYERALQVAAANRQLSTSLLQRRLRIGYPRAARLMDQLEDEGIVAASGEPGKPREVIYLPDEEVA